MLAVLCLMLTYLVMLLVAADEARKNYNEIDAKYRNIDNEIR